MASTTSRPSARRRRTPAAETTGNGGSDPGSGAYGCRTWSRSYASRSARCVLLAHQTTMPCRPWAVPEAPGAADGSCAQGPRPGPPHVLHVIRVSALGAIQDDLVGLPAITAHCRLRPACRAGPRSRRSLPPRPRPSSSPGTTGGWWRAMSRQGGPPRATGARATSWACSRSWFSASLRGWSLDGDRVVEPCCGTTGEWAGGFSPGPPSPWRQQRALTVDLTSRPSREAANRLYQKVGFEPRHTNVYRYRLSS